MAEAQSSIDHAGQYLVFEEGGRTRVVELRGDWTRIGRSLAADVRLDDPTISRRHALIVRGPDPTVILDDRSLNGVQVNGVRVSEQELKDGDTVLIGTRITLRYIERI